MTSVVERVRLRVRDEIIARIRDGLAANPPEVGDAVVLFGSIARGDFSGYSDIDVIVVGGDWDRLPPIWRWADGRGTDTLAATHDEWEAGQGVLAAARREGIVLWERVPATASGSSAGR